MRLILVTDVFGLTPALLKLSKYLGECTIVDPYKGQMMAFSNESEAYSYFIETVGLDNYLSSLLSKINLLKEEVTLIGFSVGASAIWRLSEIMNPHIKQAFCFYGSQIRNFTQIDPHFKIKLIFPKLESHFDVVTLQNNLQKKANVDTKRVEYLHGFMNYHSCNYNEVGYDAYIKMLRSITC